MRLDYLILGVILSVLTLSVIGLEVLWHPRLSTEVAPLQSRQRSQSGGSTFDAPTSNEAAPGDRAFALTDNGEAISPLLPGEPRRWPPAQAISPVLPTYPLEAGSSIVEDYSDPVTGGIVPLIKIEGLEEEFLSPHFKVKDVSAHDGAPFARISPKLVNTLEVLTRLAEAPVYISSAYRHLALNADPSVGGAPRSQHIAGRAADIWSSVKTPGELAEFALAITDCNIGLGLGRTFLHIDMRGHSASWVYDGAAMDEATFDHWVRTRCPVAVGTKPLSFATAARRAATRSAMRAAVLEDTLIAGYRDELAAFASAQFRAKGKGAVILDLRQNDGDQKTALSDQLSYVLLGSEEARQWNLNALIYPVQLDTYFIFTIIRPDGEATVGAMSYEVGQSSDR